MAHSTFARLMDAPAHCSIRVYGAITPAWASRFGGLTLAPLALGAQEPVTQLSGWLPDQAALLGVLNCLYDLGLPLLSVECEPDGPESGAIEPARDTERS